ncbi:MAG: MerR family transcriptional regulator [Desulfobulbaceae bacterium]|nr:MerR family transcriptional regulator [Desulfobulbaceae bacterium]
MKQQVAARKDIPDKVYFRIGEVSDLVGVDPHVLRYWETEFKVVRPHRAKSNQRLYRRQDVENLLLIRTLLHDEGYTISGARKLLQDPDRKEEVKAKEERAAQQDQQPSEKRLAVIKNELRRIQQILALKSLRY